MLSFREFPTPEAQFPRIVILGRTVNKGRRIGFGDVWGGFEGDREHHVAAKGNKKKIFIGPDEGTYLPVLDIVHKVTAEDFGGSLTIEEWGLPPGQMIPPHTHSREDECNFVLEGHAQRALLYVSP